MGLGLDLLPGVLEAELAAMCDWNGVWPGEAEEEEGGSGGGF